jgi:hypothetical protein
VNLVSGLYSNVRAGSPIGSCRSAGAEGQVKMVAESVAGVGTLRTSSTPSVQQPPTPPHTPKTTNMITGQTATMPLGLYNYTYVLPFMFFFYLEIVSTCFPSFVLTSIKR